jgi:predicted ATPase/class 3 adenylate cyclase
MRLLHAVPNATCYIDEDPKGPFLVTVVDAPETGASTTSSHVMIELEHEYRVTRELEIEGIRRTVRRGQIEGKAAFWTTWFAGDTLHQTSIASRQSLDRVLELAIRMTDIVGALHSARLIHGHLSPFDIRVDTAFRNIEMSGLGRATPLDVEMPPGATSLLSGERAPYASPEQTGRMNRPVDSRTDLYSIGAILYAMLTGTAPFGQHETLELVHHLVAVVPPAPHELNPNVPEMVSQIVCKLLAKDAEDRYQSADGLRIDLAHCLERLRTTGRIDSFPLASSDLATQFRLPRKLYGRESELSLLLSAFERAARGGTELVLVDGPAGIGKTMLVHELQRPVIARRGRFIEGKFEQHQRNRPFSALIRAFDAWVHLVLSESDDELERERVRIAQAVGDLGGLLTELVPDLALVIGPQPPVQSVGYSEARSRFQYVLLRFLLAIASDIRPLVIFIDDLQWADLASIELLTTLVRARDAKNLLIVGAYRADELDYTTNSIRAIRDGMERVHSHVSRIELQSLSEDAIELLVTDALSGQLAQLSALSRSLLRATDGNALFVGQLLRSMYEDRTLRFNRTISQWEWIVDERSMGALGESAGDDLPPRDAQRDVIELIASKVKRLPESTQAVLIVGACVGSRFDARTIADVLDRAPRDVVAALLPAMLDGLLVPLNRHQHVAQVGPTEDVHALYAFAHDRTEQVVYSLMAERERENTHLRLARAIAARHSDVTARVFEIVHHYNRGRGAVTDLRERRRIASLNFDAALVAKRSSAFTAALSHLEISIELLGPDAWTRDRVFALTLHTEAAECAYLSAALDRMEAHIDAVIRHGKTILETIRVYNLRVDAYTSQNRLNEALRVGQEALALLGVNFPRSPSAMHVLAGLGRTKLLLAGRNIPELAKQPHMRDPHKLEAMVLLERMVPPAYMSGSSLFPLLVFAMVDLSVRYGNSPLSPFGYGSYAITLTGVLGEIRSGELFATTALETMKNLGVETNLTKVYFVVYVFIQHWTQHLATCCDPLLEAYQSGMKTGNLVGATWSAFYWLLWQYCVSRPLADVEREASTYSSIFEQLKQHAAHRRCDMLRQIVLNLMGRTEDPVVFGGEAYADSEIAALSERGDDATSRFFYHSNKQFLSFLFGRNGDALRHGDAARTFLASVTGLPDIPLYSLYDGLARVHAAARASGPESKALLKIARAHQKKLGNWARFGPMNYEHKYNLLSAELAGISDDASARDLYDRAIQGALRHGYHQEAALAQELAARFHLGREQFELGRFYLAEAYRNYVRWGAYAKADALESQYPSLNHHDSRRTVEFPLGTRPHAAIDLESVLKATTAISREIVLDRLCSKLLEIVIENAGAERGTLVLYETSRPRVIARHCHRNETAAIIEEAADSEHEQIPESVITYVARSKRPIVIDDAQRESRFSQDPYIAREKVRSLLCAPVLHQNELIAIVCLENNLAPSSFTAERVALVHMLGGQIAVSLENAKLYRNLTMALERQVELTNAYGRFTPRAFLDLLGKESIMQVRVGDHRQGDMSVVFLDIRSYTSLAEQMSPDDNFQFINGFLRRMTPSIAEHEGVINNFIGDGVMAFFPRRPEDALAACVKMQRAVAIYNEERCVKGRRAITVGMGVHTGPLMIGVIGDHDRMDTALVSDTVNTAARMEGLTKEFHVSIVISESTVFRLGPHDRDQLRRVGDVRVKGKSHVHRVYECFGGDSQEHADAKRATRPLFERGLDAWKNADFDHALEAFAAVLAEHPDDRTARRYWERAAEYKLRGVPTEWTGIDTIERK